MISAGIWKLAFSSERIRVGESLRGAEIAEWGVDVEGRGLGTGTAATTAEASEATVEGRSSSLGCGSAEATTASAFVAAATSVSAVVATVVSVWPVVVMVVVRSVASFGFASYSGGFLNFGCVFDFNIWN